MPDFLYHFSTHPALLHIRPGDTFTLHPGRNCAEGRGVYFAEEPRRAAADALEQGGTETGCVVIPRPQSAAGWWRTKKGLARKFNRPVTWHTAGRSLTLTVTRSADGFIFCEER